MVRRSPDDRNDIFAGVLLSGLGLGGAAVVGTCSGANTFFVIFSVVGLGGLAYTPCWVIVLGCFVLMEWIGLLLTAGTTGGCLGLTLLFAVVLGGAAIDAPQWVIVLGCFVSLGLLLERCWDRQEKRWRHEQEEHLIKLDQERQRGLHEHEERQHESKQQRLREQEERRFRASELTDVDNMRPKEFEKFVGELMKRRGYATTVVGQAGDMGVDVVAQKGNRKYAVQVKRHSSRVSRRAVSDAVAGKRHYKCNAAMVVTNNYFTKGAEELARSTKCQLVDRDTLAAWIVDTRRKGD